MPTLASASLALTMAITAYLYALCVTDPNPNPDQQKRAQTDRVRYLAKKWPVLARRFFTTIAFYHALLAFYFPSLTTTTTSSTTTTDLRKITPTQTIPAKPGLCPRPWNLSEPLFTWSPVTILILVSAIIGALIRISAMGKLGKSFSFQLTAPDTLITTGVYRFVQHPSYIGVAFLYPFAGLVFNSSSSLACFFGDDVLKWVRGLPEFVVAVLVVSSLVFFTVRVKDEEKMLKAEFGDEWVRWSSRTKRLIPGIL